MAAQQNNDEDVLDEDTLIPEYIELTEDEEALVEQMANVAKVFPDGGDYSKCFIEEVPVPQMKACLSIIEKLVAHIEKQNDTISKLLIVVK